MGSSKNKRGGGYGFRWGFFSLHGSQGNAEGLNSSCVGANCIDAREHGAPAEQTACTRVTQRRAWRVMNPFKLPKVSPAGRHVPQMARRAPLETGKPSHRLVCAETHLLQSHCLSTHLSNRSYGQGVRTPPPKPSPTDAGDDRRWVQHAVAYSRGQDRPCHRTGTPGQPPPFTQSAPGGCGQGTPRLATQTPWGDSGRAGGSSRLQGTPPPHPRVGYPGVISLRFTLGSRKAMSQCS